MPNTLNIERLNTCGESGCNVPVEYRPVGRTGTIREYLHEGESRTSLIGPSETGWRGHPARPTVRCADCKGPISAWQDAWADYTGCTSCGTENRYGIGD